MENCGIACGDEKNACAKRYKSLPLEGKVGCEATRMRWKPPKAARRRKVRSAPFPLSRGNIRPLPCGSFFGKIKFRLACSVVNAFTTACLQF